MPQLDYATPGTAPSRTFRKRTALLLHLAALVGTAVGLVVLLTILNGEGPGYLAFFIVLSQVFAFIVFGLFLSRKGDRVSTSCLVSGIVIPLLFGAMSPVIGMIILIVTY